MTTGRPRLSQLSLWDRHVALILDVFRDALHLLAAQGARGTEPDLNRLLYECVLRANRNRRIAGLAALDTPVMWESRNQPSPPTTASGTAENKIPPDFQCGLIDTSALTRCCLRRPLSLSANVWDSQPRAGTSPSATSPTACPASSTSGGNTESTYGLERWLDTSRELPFEA